MHSCVTTNPDFPETLLGESHIQGNPLVPGKKKQLSTLLKVPGPQFPHMLMEVVNSKISLMKEAAV